MHLSPRLLTWAKPVFKTVLKFTPLHAVALNRNLRAGEVNGDNPCVYWSSKMKLVCPAS